MSKNETLKNVRTGSYYGFVRARKQTASAIWSIRTHPRDYVVAHIVLFLIWVDVVFLRFFGALAVWTYFHNIFLYHGILLLWKFRRYFLARFDCDIFGWGDLDLDDSPARGLSNRVIFEVCSLTVAEAIWRNARMWVRELFQGLLSIIKIADDLFGPDKLRIGAFLGDFEVVFAGEAVVIDFLGNLNVGFVRIRWFFGEHGLHQLKCFCEFEGFHLSIKEINFWLYILCEIFDLSKI